jgi:hypothetical protein
MTATPILGITEVSPSQNNKEVTINDGFLTVEQSLNKTLAVNLTSADATLTTPDFQHNFVFNCSGHTVSRNLIVVNQARYFAVLNSGTGNVVVKAGSFATTYTVVPNDFVLLHSDGSNAVRLLASGLAVGGVTPSFLGLSDAPHSYSGQASKGVRVNSGGTALEFYTITSGVTTLATLTDVNVTEGSGINGYHLAWDNSTSKWVATASGTNLAGLTDVNVTEGSGINGYVLTWNNGTSKWVATAPGVVSGAGTLAGLTDVNVTEGSGINGYYLAWNNGTSKWVAVALATVASTGAYTDLTGRPSLATVATTGAYSDLTGRPTLVSNLDDLADVVVTSAAANDYVKYNGSNFVNSKNVDVAGQAITSGTTLAINRALGEVAVISLTGTVTAFTVSNWGASGSLSRLVLEINNTGAFNISTWPTGTIWSGGTVPTITSGSGKKDLIILTTFNGGTTIFGSIAGQNFS